MRRQFDSRIKWDVFQEKSTYLNDYQWATPDERKIYKWENDRNEPPQKPPPELQLCDHETFLPWRKGVHVPFNLLWNPVPITGTNPKEKILFPENQLADPGKEEAIKTRPRIYISPAVSIDDVPDPDMRDLLCQFMYTTEWKKATEEAKIKMPPKKTPERVSESMGDPLKYEVEIVTSLPEGWRQQGKGWDKSQERAMVDPTKQFWLHKEPPVKCGACEDPLKDLLPQETKEEIRDLVETDRLRLPHDYAKPGYMGYRPRMTRGVPLPKPNYHYMDPRLSTQEALVAQRMFVEKMMAEKKKN